MSAPTRERRPNHVATLDALPRDPRPGGRLTKRQREILLLVAAGATNEEIGRELYLSVNTVRTQVRRLLAKLEARSRAHAVHRAYQLGVLTWSPLS